MFAVGLVAAPSGAREARAATHDLTIVGDARYEVLPEESLVRITVDLVARNNLRDTATRKYYFDRAPLAVPPGATAFALASPSGKPTVRISARRADHQLLALTFGQRLASGKTAKFRLTFDLPDPGGAATRNVRVGEALVSFPVWAYGYPNGVAGSSVSVVLPPGYTAHLQAGELGPPTTDAGGRTTLASGPLPDATGFFAYLVAERPAAYKDTRLDIEVGGSPAAVTIRAWPDDPDWAARVGDLFERGLPVLGQLTGVGWGRTPPLVVEEAVGGSTGGYAGLFDPAAGRMEIAYYADSLVILHEAAHAWFNGALLADRWANEAFASYYAVAAGGRLDEAIVPAPLTDELLKARIPLNAWLAGAIGEVPPDRAAEAYAYAASYGLAALIAERAGLDGLREVWRAAAAGEVAYQPPHVDAGAARPPEQGTGAPDWRGLLDLLEDRTGATYDDLWRDWVVRDDEVALLDARREVRARYDAVVGAAGRWELPRSVRDTLRAWRFEEAAAMLGDAEVLLGRRADLERAAADAGLRLPTRLEAAFEGDIGFAAAAAEADAEEATIEALVAAEAARPAAPDQLARIGLFGTAPEETLAAGRAAFSSGDLEAAASAASSAYVTWAAAAETGRNRILVGTGVAILVVLAILATLSYARGRRVARREGPGGPYVTLPGDPAASAVASPQDPASSPQSPDRGDEPTWSSRP
jgi:hypothetical protein